jgi:hypothetical protein
VYGSVIAEHASGIRICGRGILDGSRIDRFGANSLVFLNDCADVRVEGIVLRDSNAWTLIAAASRRIRIRNVKLIGAWRYNADGIDFVNCSHCSVEDSFIRSFDDSIVLKGYMKFGPFVNRMQILDGRLDGTFTVDGVTRQTFAELQERLGICDCAAAPIKDIRVRRCVVWNDWGRSLEIGAETVASEICDILFEDCDLIHTTHVAMDVQNSDRAVCSNITFRDIRVEFDDDFTRKDPYLIALEVKNGWASHDRVCGNIEDILFQDIEVTGAEMPASSKGSSTQSGLSHASAGISPPGVTPPPWGAISS